MLRVIAGVIFEHWHLLKEIIVEIPWSMIDCLKNDSIKLMKERWGESIFREINKSNSFI